jgi:hypothetical protein
VSSPKVVEEVKPQNNGIDALGLYMKSALSCIASAESLKETDD